MATHLVLTRAFGRDQAALDAHNQAFLGPREVPIAAIAGTVGRPGLLDRGRMAALRRTPRYERIREALAAGRRLPPVDLALLGGHFYIADGHHRLAAARELGALEADAWVTEYLPAAGSPAAAWHRARAAFERDTGLAGLHTRVAAGHARLRAQIAEHAWYLGERGAAAPSFAAAAAAWQRQVYWPALAHLAARGVLDRERGLTPTELYLAVCDHKWYRSERLARDIGFAAAVADYGRGAHLPWPRRLRGVLETGRALLAVSRLLLAA